MRYVRAQDIFPADLLEKIQCYIDGEYIYIPCREGKKRTWGEKSRCKEELALRNRAIYREHTNGAAVDELAGRYFLSDKSIRRILLEQRRADGG